MTFLDFLSPVLRRPFQWILSFLLIAGMVVSVKYILPPIEKHTMFFTVKPVAAEEKSFLNDGVESAEKIAEMISGWAKDPNFQQDVLKTSGVNISGLKRKMAARKQNRLNVFWTLQLSGKDTQKSDALLSAIETLLTQKIEETNIDSVIPIKITKPHTAKEPLEIPLSWVILAALVLGLGGATVLSYFRESFLGRVSFVEQIHEVFPESAIFSTNTKIEKHDARRMNEFLETFELPHLIGTFSVAGKYFDITSISKCMETEGTPLLLVKLGETTLRELRNLEATFGDNIGIIVFEK